MCRQIRRQFIYPAHWPGLLAAWLGLLTGRSTDLMGGDEAGRTVVVVAVSVEL